MDWNQVFSREDLLVARMSQLDHQQSEHTDAASRLRHSRESEKARFDSHMRLRPEHQELAVGDFILLYNSAFKTSHNRKMNDY